MRVHVTDYETETNPWFGQVASPYCPDNYVVLEAGEDLLIGGGEVQYEKRWETRYASIDDWKANWKGLRVKPDTMIVVAHNAAYEMSWWLEHDYENFMAFLKRGGRVYCTAYAHYLLSNMQDTYPALNDTAPLYGGTPKVDAVKALWEAGVKTSDIDSELLSEYLSGPCGDIANTTKVFLGTWEQLKERNMLKMAMVRMDALLFSSVCMHHGLRVDIDHAKALQAESEKRLAELHSQVYKLLPKKMPAEAVKQFKFTRFQQSALIFGGPMKYKGQVHRTDADGKFIMKKAEGPFFKSIKEALPESECLFDEEAGGLWYNEKLKEHQARYSSGKRKGEPKFEKYDTDEIDTKIGEFTFQFDGLVLGDVRTKLASAIESEWSGEQRLADGTPVVSTAGDVLDVLAAHDVPGSKWLQEIAKLDKDLGSFYLKQKFNADGSIKSESGMLQYVQPDNFIHHTLNHTSTVTSRLSSNKPNMQQIPRGDTSRVKEMFVSRFGSDGGILQEDYSALETVGLQVFTGDTHLKDALLAEKDMHSIRLASMEELDYDYVVARTKDKKHPEHAEWDVKRTDVKPVAFQYQYGATAYGMAMSTGKSQEFCQAFIDAEQKAFPEVEDWYNDVVFATVERTARERKPTRVQLDDGRYVLFHTGVFTTPDGTTYQFRQHKKSKWDSVLRQRVEVSEFTIPQMRNYPVQGGSGFFVQLACGMLIRHFIANDMYGGKCLPINTVHDAVYMDCHKDVVYQAAYEVEAIMECIPEMLNSMWPAFNCEVPFPVAGGYGPSMAVEEDVYEDTPEAKDAFKAAKAKFKKEFLAKRKLEVMF
ncbi:hypothetical protein fHeYen301_26 [Yersinia phage fHe-Yen3-01]|uniref:DNA-directed DNA polymerase family A palm domain-containing protein n=1 Tax=Yersinia phage fHe-Yen3-01 TaxID=1932893 RepID=A0A1L7DQG1_9CAUD|nr:DNA polymerase [Yersinia phage fHe-Yen3-01]APU00359.1 hypothetical protein fHeYen301_26 [Yersinia phage fHe-Yen3-01]